jgi:hypothetical protein
LELEVQDANFCLKKLAFALTEDSREPWFREIEFTVPDVSLEGDPRPELVYFIVQRLNISDNVSNNNV